MDSEYAPEEQEVTLEPLDVETTTETGETGADIGAATPVGAPVVTDHGDIEAQTVHISQGGAQNVTAEKVTVEQGGIARAEGRFIDVHEGGIAIATGENITISNGGAAIVAAENVKMQDSVALFVAASSIEGEDTLVIFDVRAAVIFALVLGFVSSLFKLLSGRRR
jgi:hypothetical protein